MNEKKTKALDTIDAASDFLYTLADDIWEHPETCYHEQHSAQVLCDALEKEGFALTKNLADIPTAFMGSYGNGSPVIGFLGEFDALPNMSQCADITEKSPVCEGAAGHGCGHNLLGVGSLAAAIALKNYLKENSLPGTVRYYGCPAEEGGAGKGFMARDGAFDGTDIAFCWHPGEVNSASTESTMANYQICYRFHGTASHAAMTPELGRSALDALELMNTGVQYLREHIPTSTRVHYAITNAGGTLPATVQAYAEAMYLMRAPELSMVKELYERVNKVAYGAAMMTETTVEPQFIKACSNMVLNSELLRVIQKNLEEVPTPQYTEDELGYAKAIKATTGRDWSYYDTLMADYKDESVKEKLAAHQKDVVHNTVLPLPEERQGFVSSDVGDASWIFPIAQINVATTPSSVAMHSWQMVAVGKSSIAKKGMLYAGKVMAGAAIDALENPEIISKAKTEHKHRRKGIAFTSPIPPEIKPKFK